MSFIKFKKAFTLTEIMIVLTIIGVITAVILPIGINAIPDENVMKFKKAHSTLNTIVRELVNSDKYYLNGEMNKTKDNVDVTAGHLCNAMSDIVAVKTVSCKTSSTGQTGYVDMSSGLDTIKANVDKQCKDSNSNANIGQFTTSDGILWYDANPTIHFASNSLATQTSNGFLSRYKVFCIDVDGAGAGEDPFGYGIRVDGKVITGARADEWIQKNIQGKD